MKTLNLRISIGRSPSRLALLLIPLVFACFALPDRAQALVPPPDGAYPNFTTAEGQNALQSLTTGSANTAVGWYSLFSDAEGSFNTATGAGALLSNTADNNTAVGGAALLFNIDGSNNTAVGAAALLFNTHGYNTAVGAFALFSNTEGFLNTANGARALYNNTSGFHNTADGYQALFSNSTGQFNTAIGDYALFNNTTGSNNIAIGSNALLNATGFGNIAIGKLAGEALTTGNGNIDIDNDGVAGEANTIRIGNATHTATYIAGLSGQTAPGGAAVFVTAAGKLGTVTSSRRFKKDIADMDSASEALLALRPVTFRYKPELDQAGIPQYGLVAEEVAEVNPDLVVRDEKGEIYTVRYEAVNAMLLNEFIKEHRKVEKLEVTVADLVATVKEQASQIQKVSTQVETSKFAARRIRGGGPSPRTVAGN
jgi:hypothetical protein